MMHAEFSNPFSNAKIVGTFVDTAAYLAQDHKRGEPGFVMSSSEVREFLRCPSRWRDGYREDSSPSTDYGDLLDCLVTNPARLEKEFRIRPSTYTNEDGETKKWNANAKVCKDWLEQHSAWRIVKPEDYQDAKKAAEKLAKCKKVGPYLEACKDRQVHVAGQYVDRETGITVPVKSLTDLVPDKNHESLLVKKSIADFKTSRDASPHEWPKTLFSYGYYIQSAWHLDLYVAATGEDRDTFCHIIQESFPPYQTAGRVIDSEFLNLGRAHYMRALKMYCQCLASSDWPDYDYDARDSYGGWAFVKPLPWMMSAA